MHAIRRILEIGKRPERIFTLSFLGIASFIGD